MEASHIGTLLEKVIGCKFRTTEFQSSADIDYLNNLDDEL